MTEAKDKNSGYQYPFYIHDQYIKDLSFENPNFLMKYNETEQQPEVSVNVESTVAKINENNYEVTLKIDVKSVVGETTVFVTELLYGALVAVDPSLQNDVLEPILLVHCPFLMFPFAREIVSNITRSGGYPPLLIEPIDFASLYIEKKKSIEAEKTSSPAA